MADLHCPQVNSPARLSIQDTQIFDGAGHKRSVSLLQRPIQSIWVLLGSVRTSVRVGACSLLWKVADQSSGTNRKNFQLHGELKYNFGRLALSTAQGIIERRVPRKDSWQATASPPCP